MKIILDKDDFAYMIETCSYSSKCIDNEGPICYQFCPLYFVCNGEPKKIVSMCDIEKGGSDGTEENV